MEHITLTAANASSETGNVLRLWLGLQEVTTADRSLAYWLADMQHQGWQLKSSHATLQPGGMLCEYQFQRSRAVRAPASGKATAP